MTYRRLGISYDRYSIGPGCRSHTEFMGRKSFRAILYYSRTSANKTTIKNYYYIKPTCKNYLLDMFMLRMKINLLIINILSLFLTLYSNMYLG